MDWRPGAEGRKSRHSKWVSGQHRGRRARGCRGAKGHASARVVGQAAASARVILLAGRPELPRERRLAMIRDRRSRACPGTRLTAGGDAIGAAAGLAVGAQDRDL
jgi:hypothetical protein